MADALFAQSRGQRAELHMNHARLTAALALAFERGWNARGGSK